MSSKANNHHIGPIHPGNYEEYFILYLDNELSEAQMAEVDAFLLQHPGLKAEFDLLMGLKLPVDELEMPGKEALLADRMKADLLSEDLLLYLDDELPAEKRAEIASQIGTDPLLAREYSLLQQTKLDPSEIMAYPNKAELYRREERKARPFPWIRAAAAVLIVAGLGTAYWVGTDKGPENTGVAATGSKAPVQQESPAPLPSSPADAPALARTEAPVKVEAGESTEVPAGKSRRNSPKKVFIPADAPVMNNELLAVHTPEVRTPASGTEETADEALQSPASKEIINNHAVTSADGGALNIQITANANTRITAAAEAPANDDFGPGPDNRRKGSVKSLLRKATRLIERGTGINPVNEDDELLIGALAVKLK